MSLTTKTVAAPASNSPDIRTSRRRSKLLTGSQNSRRPSGPKRRVVDRLVHQHGQTSVLTVGRRWKYSGSRGTKKAIPQSRNLVQRYSGNWGGIAVVRIFRDRRAFSWGQRGGNSCSRRHQPSAGYDACALSIPRAQSHRCSRQRILRITARRGWARPVPRALAFGAVGLSRPVVYANRHGHRSDLARRSDHHRARASRQRTSLGALWRRVDQRRSVEKAGHSANPHDHTPGNIDGEPSRALDAPSPKSAR